MPRLTAAEAIDRYGPIVEGRWADESKWCVTYNVPKNIAGSWVNPVTNQPVHHIYCNRDIILPLDQALSNVWVRCLLPELRTFDGCFNIRDVRGEPGKLSTHAYALAIDINARTNRLGTPGDLSDELAKCFTDAGFIWGKQWLRQDPQHFQFASW